MDECRSAEPRYRGYADAVDAMPELGRV